MQPVFKQRIGKHASTIKELLLETMFSIRPIQSGYKEENGGTQFSRGLAVQLNSARETEKRLRSSSIEIWQSVELCK
jgi:hypothetical protein